MAPASDADECPVMALVASAGGLEAVSTILAALPASLPAALLVLIHQAPDRVSRLTQILARASSLPVATAEHGMALRPGEVLIAPPGSHLLVTADRTVALVKSGDAPPSRPSADLLLATLGVAVGPRAVAVVLTGGGHDGATGASAIHAFGGTVVATDEVTSTVFSMPKATIERDRGVAHVVALDDVAPLLTRLAAG